MKKKLNPNNLKLYGWDKSGRNPQDLIMDKPAVKIQEDNCPYSFTGTSCKGCVVSNCKIKE